MNTSSPSPVVAAASAPSTAANKIDQRSGSSFANLFTVTAVVAVMLSLVAPHTFAAPPPVTVVQPVQVQVVNTATQPAQVEVTKPVQVQGGVEVLNDALCVPYLRSVTVNYPNSYGSFSIPAGKRLIIETIAVEVLTKFPDSKSVPQLYTPAGDRFPLAVQFLGVDTTGYGHLVGTQSIKLRYDAPSGPSQTTFLIEYAGADFFRASIAGYLVDL
jgi:hypothetical protein